MAYRPYVRKANYYETDEMGLIHHSNYFRWFEEARVDFLEQIGWPYEKWAALGVLGSPVLSISCDYKNGVRFGETVQIKTEVTQFTGFRATFTYRIIDAQTGQLRATGESKLCFVGEGGRPVSLKRVVPPLYQAMLETLQGEK